MSNLIDALSRAMKPDVLEGEVCVPSQRVPGHDDRIRAHRARVAAAMKRIYLRNKRAGLKSEFPDPEEPGALVVCECGEETVDTFTERLYLGWRGNKCPRCAKRNHP